MTEVQVLYTTVLKAGKVMRQSPVHTLTQARPQNMLMGLFMLKTMPVENHMVGV